MGRTRNALTPRGVRGFESLPLRHTFSPRTVPGFSGRAGLSATRPGHRVLPASDASFDQVPQRQLMGRGRRAVRESTRRPHGVSASHRVAVPVGGRAPTHDVAADATVIETRVLRSLLAPSHGLCIHGPGSGLAILYCICQSAGYSVSRIIRRRRPWPTRTGRTTRIGLPRGG